MWATLSPMPHFAGDALMAHANGGCYRCGRGDSLIDTDAQIVAEGALVLCRGCIADCAEAAGLIVNAARVAEIEAAHIEERRTFCPERVAELEAELATALSALEVSQRVEAKLQTALSRVGK